MVRGLVAGAFWGLIVGLLVWTMASLSLKDREPRAVRLQDPVMPVDWVAARSAAPALERLPHRINVPKARGTDRRPSRPELPAPATVALPRISIGRLPVRAPKPAPDAPDAGGLAPPDTLSAPPSGTGGLSPLQTGRVDPVPAERTPPPPMPPAPGPVSAPRGPAALPEVPVRADRPQTSAGQRIARSEPPAPAQAPAPEQEPLAVQTQPAVVDPTRPVPRLPGAPRVAFVLLAGTAEQGEDAMADLPDWALAVADPAGRDWPGRDTLSPGDDSVWRGAGGARLYADPADPSGYLAARDAGRPAYLAYGLIADIETAPAQLTALAERAERDGRAAVLVTVDVAGEVSRWLNDGGRTIAPVPLSALRP